MRWIGVKDRNDSQSDSIIGDSQQQQKSNRRVTITKHQPGNQPGERDIGCRWYPPAVMPNLLSHRRVE
jgi:hypothetical protein